MEVLQQQLALVRTPGLGPNTLKKLQEHGIDPLELHQTKSHTLLGLGLSQATVNALACPDWSQVDGDIRIMEQTGVGLLFNPETLPELLRQSTASPYWLFVKGDLNLLSRPSLAVVGSRHPSWLGKELAEEFAASLTGRGLTIVSGLAQGIDSAAHQGCLNAGGGTIAVCGTGLDVVYPRRNRGLAREIGKNGLMVSEYPPGTRPLAHHFPQRNRIISGLSLGTLVVEAARRSGSLITARLAAEQGREVFAIPGSLHNPLSKGCHRLIRQGAKLVEDMEDILEELQQLAQIPFEHTEKPPNIEQPDLKAQVPKEWQELLDILSVAPMSLDRLMQQSTLTQDRLCSMLLRMELAGIVASAPGGVFVRKTL